MRLHNGESQACTGDELIDLDETLEDTCLIRLVNTLSRIRNFFRNRPRLSLPALLVIEVILRDRAQPGDTLNFFLF